MFKWLEEEPPKWLERVAVWAGAVTLFLVLTLAAIGAGSLLALWGG